MKIGNPPVNTPFLLPGADTINPVWHEWLANIATQLSGTVLLPATTAETKAGAVSDKGITPAGLLAAVGFSAYFESAEQTITSAGALQIPHGFGREPILLWFILVCKTNEAGWVAGEKVHLGSVAGLGFSGNTNFGVMCDTTNIYLTYGSRASVFDYVSRSSGAAVALTNTSWRLVIRAWA